MESVLDFGRGRQKWLKSCMGSAWVGGGEPDKHRSPCAGYKARSSPRLCSCWPHSCLSAECLFPLLPPFSVSRGAVQWSIKNAHTIGARQLSLVNFIHCFAQCVELGKNWFFYAESDLLLVMGSGSRPWFLLNVVHFMSAG
jgi:hypothetical protein